MAERQGEWLPWYELMRVCVIHIGLTPDAFWQLSLNELRALLSASKTVANTAPNHHEMQALMALFPDQ